MGAFDGLRDKAEGLLGQHGDKVEGISDTVVEKAGDAIDAATGGKFSDKIDSVQEKADGVIGE
jgi:MT0933-like antitoxin protein